MTNRGCWELMASYLSIWQPIFAVLLVLSLWALSRPRVDYTSTANDAWSVHSVAFTYRVSPSAFASDDNVRADA